MKCFLVITFFLSAISLSFGQGDTIINNRTYSILEKHSNGKAKYIGQFSTTCLDDTVRKHGFFIRFDTEGKEIGKKLYFFDEERNRKTLGLNMAGGAGTEEQKNTLWA